MDWGKAKSILITVFILLNIFLLTNIGINKFSNASSKAAISSTVTILENKGIQLDCDIPSTESSMGRLEMHDAAGFSMSKAAQALLGSSAKIPDNPEPGSKYVSDIGEFSVEDVKSFTYRNTGIKTNIDISRDKTVEKNVRTVVEDAGIKASEFVLDSYEKAADGSIKLEFIQKYRGYKIFSNNIRAVVTHNGIRELYCSIGKPSILGSKEDAILPAYKMLLTNFGELTDLVITSIDIGYNMDRMENGKPLWRVKIDGQSTRYYDASSGVEK